jgi:hypothetical protein
VDEKSPLCDTLGPHMLSITAAFAMAHSVTRVRAASVFGTVAARLFCPSFGKLPKL